MFDPYTREAQFFAGRRCECGGGGQHPNAMGMAMGPLAYAIWQASMSVGASPRIYQHEHPKDQRDVLVVDRLYEMGRYGQKTGAGWYRYEGRNAASDPVVEDLITQCAEQAGIGRRKLSAMKSSNALCIRLSMKAPRFSKRGWHFGARYRHHLRLWVWLSQPSEVAPCSSPIRLDSSGFTIESANSSNSMERCGSLQTCSPNWPQTEHPSLNGASQLRNLESHQFARFHPRLPIDRT